MKFSGNIFIAAAPLLLAACTTASLPSMGASENIAQTSIGRTGMIGDIGITPTKVIEDSRCPINVQCASAGRVVVTTQLTSPTGNQTFDMVFGTPVSFAGGSVTLSEVEPQLAEGRYPAQSDYLLTYRYDGGSSYGGSVY